MSVKSWYYQIEVREGAPGFADDDDYKSKMFDNFEECFISYIHFNPSEYWNDLRCVYSEKIIYTNITTLHKIISLYIYMLKYLYIINIYIVMYLTNVWFYIYK